MITRELGMRLEPRSPHAENVRVLAAIYDPPGCWPSMAVGPEFQGEERLPVWRAGARPDG